MRGHHRLGPVRHEDIRDRMGNCRFVSDAYVKTASDGYVTHQCG
ncbi:hypothetical protein [Streptomyces sp. NRRL F-2580]|nr:hypothetical protein [Streptomyces sp. NRRL F-2580]